jgi:arylsulfatase A-like enzyme
LNDDAETLSLSRNFLPRHPFDNGALLIRDELLAPHPRTAAAMRRHLADYYATISDLDHQVGRILRALEERGGAGDTVIIFTSDQGLAVGGRHGLMGKQNLYEHVKPPLILAGPGIPHGRSDALVYLFDLFPTICELAGVATPAVVEGKSLVPVIRGEAPWVRDSLLGAYADSQRMVRDGRWKLIRYRAGGVRNAQLFDLKDDPDELTNLADDPRHRGERERLERLLAEARARFGDPVDFEATTRSPVSGIPPTSTPKVRSR